jgi:hypothetical protein
MLTASTVTTQGHSSTLQLQLKGIRHLYSNHGDPPVHHHRTLKFPLLLLQLGHLITYYKVLICNKQTQHLVSTPLFMSLS